MTDWVTERNKCSIDKVFEQMRLDVKDDVEKRQELRVKHPEFGFLTGFHFNSSTSKFSASTQRQGGSLSITFCNRKSRIAVMDENDKEFMSGTLTLTDDMECRIVVSGESQPLEPWQFRKRALEKLFFGGDE